MAQTTVNIRTVQGQPTAVGWSGDRTITIDRPEAAGGMGLGYNGGELLCLALGACFCNDIWREAERLGIEVVSVDVEVAADWAGEPVIAQNVGYSTTVRARAAADEIKRLIEHTDRVAEIHNTLRSGVVVTLFGAKAITVGA